MGHPQSKWRIRKFKSRRYTGRYIRYADGERTFVLECLLRSGRKHRISFESYVAAKELGWRKCR